MGPTPNETYPNGTHPNGTLTNGTLKGASMSRHRALRGRGRRGMARWPIVAIGTALVLVLGWMGWRYAGVVVARQAAAQAASCAEGESTLTVAVNPSMADLVTRAA